MNITGGSFRGRKINTVKSRDVRPTSSKVREGIFNIINSINRDILHHGNAMVLDLFAGSGILGLEAISRGAGKVIYVEKNSKVVRMLKENLSKFEIDYELIVSDAIAALDRLKEIKFNLIFIDPPYASKLIEPAISRIISNNLLNPAGLIVVEHSPDLKVESFAEQFGLNVLKERNYGDTSITILADKD